MKLTKEIIRIVRINLNITQGKLARTAGISATLLSSIERDERPLTHEVAASIRTALPVSDEQIADIIEANRRLNAGRL